MWKYSVIHEADRVEFKNGSLLTMRWDVTFDYHDPADHNRIRGTGEQLYRTYVDSEWVSRDITIWDRIDNEFYDTINNLTEDRIPINSVDASRQFSDCCRRLELDYGDQIRLIRFTISDDPIRNLTNIDWYAYMIGNIQDSINVPYSRRVQISDEVQERGINRASVPVYVMGNRDPIGYTRGR